MDLKLKNKIVIVTGGAGGIGKAIARTLAGEGAIPCILDLKKAGDLSICVDLTGPAACREAVEAVRKRHGRIDGLVNNAGLNDFVGLETGDHNGFLRSLERNAGHYYDVAMAARAALGVSQGSIVNIVSNVAETGQGNTSGYAAANGVRTALTQEWDVMAADGIRVNAVVVAECRDQSLTRSDEIADTVVFLLSPASRGVNGELIHVDGGYVHLDRRAV